MVITTNTASIPMKIFLAMIALSGLGWCVAMAGATGPSYADCTGQARAQRHWYFRNVCIWVRRRSKTSGSDRHTKAKGRQSAAFCFGVAETRSGTSNHSLDAAEIIETLQARNDLLEREAPYFQGPQP
jgi:hypothetical protein